jgi:hypothetical protein
MQNCHEFGTYEPPGSHREFRTLCHGGYYNGDYYEVCPVRDKCRDFSINKRQLPVYNNPVEAARSQATRESQPVRTVNPNYRVSAFEPPNYYQIPTVMPAGAQPIPGTTQPPPNAAQPPRPAQQAAQAAQQQWPNFFKPPQSNPKGMRTPFLHDPFVAGVSPSFLPNEETGETTFERLLLNIIQGIFASIAWHIWSFLRTIDLFA